MEGQLNCENCDHCIIKGEEMWNNETQQVLCKLCYDDEQYYLEHIDEYELS